MCVRTCVRACVGACELNVSVASVCICVYACIRVFARA